MLKKIFKKKSGQSSNEYFNSSFLKLYSDTQSNKVNWKLLRLCLV